MSLNLAKLLLDSSYEALNFHCLLAATRTELASIIRHIDSELLLLINALGLNWLVLSAN